MIASFMGVSVIGHGNPIIAKRRNLLNSQLLAYKVIDRHHQDLPNLFKDSTDGRSKQMADAPRYHAGIPSRISTTSAGKDPKIF
jgi:hypothetical protein